ncbi:MAG: hypothetical protein Q9172_002960 [Xanthocarpia lactea]
MDSNFSLRKRLLRDIAELQTEPYPYIEFHIKDSLERACLILTPEGSQPLHLTMTLDNYPLHAPKVTIQSPVCHPNVFGDYICASILNTQEGYTPAYTLKSIAIQLLSFFRSDSLEQDYGELVNLSTYQAGYASSDRHFRRMNSPEVHCDACNFAARSKECSRNGPVLQRRPTPAQQHRPAPARQHYEAPERQQGRVMKGHLFVVADKLRRLSAPIRPSQASRTKSPAKFEASAADTPVYYSKPFGCSSVLLMSLPDEILLMLFSFLSFEELVTISNAFPRAREVINRYDLIRVRELQCFCLKEGFQHVKLGVGVRVGQWGKERKLSSEFDLLSHEAFHQYCVRRSIQGLPFEHWLPLPISQRHFRKVGPDMLNSLSKLASAGKCVDSSHFSVISHFMNDIVVSFSAEAERCPKYGPRSTLAHASEKAVESYFAIYHLLLCLAADDPFMVAKANSKVSRFISGERSKNTCPSLGHLLVATLISDDGITEDLSLAVIEEAVLRNVVWMLDSRGADMPELSYLEPSAISEYRLRKTFEASLTSYRLLMFSHLFCKIARGPAAEKPLAQLRDELFDTHGAPPRGLARSMAEEIRRIKSIDSFPPFLMEMGIQEFNLPGKSEWTGFLQNMVRRSAEVGYSCMPISQTVALSLRKMKEPDVEVGPDVVAEKAQVATGNGRLSFFPNNHSAKNSRKRNGYA